MPFRFLLTFAAAEPGDIRARQLTFSFNNNPASPLHPVAPGFLRSGRMAA